MDLLLLLIVFGAVAAGCVLGLLAYTAWEAFQNSRRRTL
jgi:uncharacterized protein involved in exopolysaccharide biosynthesis